MSRWQVADTPEASNFLRLAFSMYGQSWSENRLEGKRRERFSAFGKQPFQVTNAFIRPLLGAFLMPPALQVVAD